MNVRCTICHRVVPGPRVPRCPECGARAELCLPTLERAPVRAAARATGWAWEFSPDGPRLRRI